jgi:hypothetical protein
MVTLTKADFGSFSGSFQDTKSTRIPYEPSPVSSYSSPVSSYSSPVSSYSSPVSSYSSPVSSYSSPVSSSISNLSASISSSISGLSSSISGLSSSIGDYGLTNTTIYQPGGGLNANGLPNNGDTSPYGQGFVGDPILTLGGGISAFTPIGGQCPSGYQLLPHPNIVGAQVCTNVGGVRLASVGALLNRVQEQGFATIRQWMNAWANTKRDILANRQPPDRGPTKQPPIRNPFEPTPGGPTTPTTPGSPTTPGGPTTPTTPGSTVTPSPVGLDDNLFDVISNLFPGGAGNLDLQGSPRDSEGLIFADYPAEISVPQSSSRSPVLIILVVLGLAAGGYWYYKNRM